MFRERRMRSILKVMKMKGLKKHMTLDKTKKLANGNEMPRLGLGVWRVEDGSEATNSVKTKQGWAKAFVNRVFPAKKFS